jgi:hypothetical protein
VRTPHEAREYIAHLRDSGFTGVIAKPSYSGYSYGVKIFQPVDRMTPRSLPSYLHKMRKGHYAKQTLTIQEFVGSFKSNFEVRTFWAGENYAYSVATKTRKVTGISGRDSGLPIDAYATFASEGGKMDDALLKRLKALGRSVIRALPTVSIPYALLRIDFGCCLKEDCTKYFVNEVEFSPNLLLDRVKDPEAQLAKIADAMYNYAADIKKPSTSLRPGAGVDGGRVPSVCKFKPGT